MPIFYQHSINEHTKLGIWEIVEDEHFFLSKVPVHRDVSHPAKRLQHLAGRFLLQYLFSDFPYELIQIADTRKPYLENEAYHFSISHCGQYAAAIVSRKQRVGIDVEIIKPMIEKIIPKFLNDDEQFFLNEKNKLQNATLMWSAKESIYKWWGNGGVDFKKDILLQPLHFENANSGTINCCFEKIQSSYLKIHFTQWDELILAFVADHN